MKYKDDFITNSSSAAFFFIFKRDSKEHLFALIRKYKEKFNLSCDFSFSVNGEPATTNYKFVIDAIEGVLGVKTAWRDNIVEIQELNDLIKKYELDIKFWEKEAAKDSWSNDMLHSYSEKLQKLTIAKQSGFTHFLEIEFGDNHGDVHGIEDPLVLDYNHKDVNLNEDDFIIITESRH
jgi:hypothetical protein